MNENKYVKTYMGKSRNAFQRALVVTPIKTGNLRYKAMKYKRNKGRNGDYKSRLTNSSICGIYR